MLYLKSNGDIRYYDLVAVKDNTQKIGWNCMPVCVFTKAVLGKNSTESSEERLIEIFNKYDRLMTRDDFDKMVEKENLYRESDKYFEEFEKHISVSQIIKDLTNGKTIVFETMENLFGETVSIYELYINSARLFETWHVNCFNSKTFGFGTCNCNSHPASFRDQISPSTALQLIVEYIKSSEMEEKKKISERNIIQRMLEMAS